MTRLTQPIHIVGISTITSNEEAFKQNTIGKLWEEFLKKPLKEKLNNLTSANIYAVYSDYENKHHGKYKITIGYAVASINNIPHDLSAITIPAGEYKQFNPKNPTPTDIIETWNEIWNSNKEILPRNYVADFEEYSDTGAKILIGY